MADACLFKGALGLALRLNSDIAALMETTLIIHLKRENQCKLCYVAEIFFIFGISISCTCLSVTSLPPAPSFFFYNCLLLPNRLIMLNMGYGFPLCDQSSLSRGSLQ